MSKFIFDNILSENVPCMKFHLDVKLIYAMRCSE